MAYMCSRNDRPILTISIADEWQESSVQATNGLWWLCDQLILDFDNVAVDDWAWLREVLDLGYTREEIAVILLEKHQDSPWIFFEPWETSNDRPQPFLHLPNCVHAEAQESEHVALLQDHERGVVETVAALCGIAGVSPTARDPALWTGIVSFEGKAANVTYGYGDPTGQSLLQRVQCALSSFCTAAARLQEGGYCCNSFTVLCSRGEGVVELCPINFSTAGDLLDGVNGTLRYQDDGDGDCHDALSRCMSAASEILETFTYPSGFRSGLPSAGCNHSDVAKTCASAAQVLCLGLLSYSQAHVGHLHPFFLDHALDEVRLFGADPWDMTVPHILVHLVDLTCVGSMLREPVIVFAEVYGVSADATSAGGMGPQRRSDVLASPEDFVDTWGPGNFVWSSDGQQQHMLSSILIGGGSIQTASDDTGKLHWSKGWNSYHQSGETFSARTKLLIGAYVDVNPSCTLSEADCISLCNSHMDRLGSFNAHWETREKQLGLQLGQYANIQYNAIRNKVPGRTLKEHHMLRPMSEVVVFLESPWGLQISVCSGLARRVRMRELMADLLHVIVARMTSPPQAWVRLRDLHRCEANLRSGKLYSWLSDMASTDRDCHDLVCTLVRAVATTLQDTGIDPDGRYFTAAWVPNEPTIDYQCVKIPTNSSNFWTRMLRDSSDCATYAYLTTECLTIDGWGCRHEPLTTWRNEVRLMETEVLRLFDLCSSAHKPQPQSLIQHGEKYMIGRLEKDSRLQLLAQVDWPATSDRAQLIIRESGIPEVYMRRFLLLRKQQGRLRERLNPHDNVQPVLVTSLPCQILAGLATHGRSSTETATEDLK